MKIKIKRGLTIPLIGAPEGKVQSLPLPNEVALELSALEGLTLTLLKKEGEEVKVGEPIVGDKKCPKRVFVSPGSGKIKEVLRGAKRRILAVVIETDQKQTPFRSEKGAMETLAEGGLLPHIELRPCNRIAHPQIQPEVIFVKAIESAPFAPPPELEVEGMEDYFAVGLEGLESLAPIHLVHREGSCCSSFTSPSCGKVHSATGPHPIGNASVHIAALHPIKTVDQAVWVLTVSDVIAIGMWLKEGRYYTEKVVGVGGEGIPENRRGYFRVNRGCGLNGLVEGGGDSVRIISGDPLCGMSSFGFLGFKHNVVCAIPEKDKGQEFLPFLKLTRKGYTASKAYFFRKRKAGFTTSQHGEERAFVDGTIYDAVMPLKIEVMPLIKHLLSEDMEKGGALGLLEVAPEDFALPAFVCPSKIDMIEIVKQGLKRYAEQYT